jgi:hypothetical protein
MAGLVRTALFGIACFGAAVLLTAAAYFAFDRPVVALLPGALVDRHLWPEPAPPDLRIARMLTVNVALLTAMFGSIIGGYFLVRFRRK